VRADVEDVGDVANGTQRLLEHHAVIGGIGRAELRPALGILRPREDTAVDDGAADARRGRR
jgi:hypothetical protein